MKKILFLCTGNSCRSQMAEGWCRQLHGELFQVTSAGITKHGLNPVAVTVMAEAGIDISKQYSKTTSDLGDTVFDYVITVCGHANEHCPFFPARTRLIHQGFDDPPTLAQDMNNEEDRIAIYRRVRDEIGEYIAQLPSLCTDDTP